MKTFSIFLMILSTALIPSLRGQGVRHPFPNHTRYAEGTVLPDNYTREELDLQTEAFYDLWKAYYLRNDCAEDQYYVFFDSGNTINVSEGLGFGMVIVPLMAGYDPDAKKYFDGMYRFYKAHPSHINHYLMAWKQVEGCKDADGPDSASDGDIDIAFGLLLAHAQWGSNHEINYFQEALNIINAILEDDVNNNLWSVKLGDWVHASSPHYYNATRTSDFITDHFRVFAAASQNQHWNDVVSTCYNLIDSMQINYSPNTGLLPDFIVDADSAPKPAEPDFLEGEHDGEYYYNACRDPWRITTDYLINGNSEAYDALSKINSWLRAACDDDVDNIGNGYHLNGDRIHAWHDPAFAAPFAVASMIDSSNQQWLNDLYDDIKNTSFNSMGYYENSIKMLCMIDLSGNYWVPEDSILNAVVSNPGKNGIKVYTDAENRMVIRDSSGNKYGNYYIRLTGLNGNAVFNMSGKGKLPEPVDISGVSPGLYLLQIVSDSPSAHAVFKIVIAGKR